MLIDVFEEAKKSKQVEMDHVPAYSHSNRWSELAEHAVTNGLSLAKSVGAKVTVIIVEEPFDWLSETRALQEGDWWLSVPEMGVSQQALDKRAIYNEQVEKYAAGVLGRAA